MARIRSYAMGSQFIAGGAMSDQLESAPIPISVVPEFRAWLVEVGKPSGKTPEQVWALWRSYCNTCQSFDQSPVQFEFLEWHRDELAAPIMQPCTYCDAPTHDDSAMPVCNACLLKIERREYGTCDACGHAMDARGYCTAPLSAAD